MNENDVRRVLSEKKEGYNVEAGGILHDVKYDLECAGIEKVRVINRYDVSGITDEEYEKAKTVVFSEPPVDTVSDETVDLSGAAKQGASHGVVVNAVVEIRFEHGERRFYKSAVHGVQFVFSHFFLLI